MQKSGHRLNAVGQLLADLVVLETPRLPCSLHRVLDVLRLYVSILISVMHLTAALNVRHHQSSSS